MPPLSFEADHLAGCTGAHLIKHLATCAGPGVMLALFSAGAMTVDVGACKDFGDVKLPLRQLEMDVRGKLGFFRDLGDVEVGEIKRNEKSFGLAKMQLVRRAELFKWAMQAASPTTVTFRLVGHLFIPRASGAQMPDDDMAEEVRKSASWCILCETVFSVHCGL